jgi:hypothetical protein
MSTLLLVTEQTKKTTTKEQVEAKEEAQDRLFPEKK